MSENLPSHVPSLSRAFEPERAFLQKGLGDEALTASQIVSEARRALDRTGARFTQDITDPHIQKAGLWLLEMVKAGAGVLDQGTSAEIVWHEIPPEKPAKWLGQTGFFVAAAALATYAFFEQSRLAVLSIAILALIRLFDRDNLRLLRNKIPFLRSQYQLEDKSGRQIEAEARVRANIAGFVDGLTDAIKTADHILLRLSEPETEIHWRDDPRLMALVQGLLEAREADDGDFALKLIGQELESILASEGVKRIEYSPKTAKYFDVLPGMGTDKPKLAAPALMAGNEVIRRGTVWGAEE